VSASDEPKFMVVQSDSDSFQKTIKEALLTLGEFKAALEGLPDNTIACVKFFIPESKFSQDGANIWLTNPFFEDGYCYAQPFELPKEFNWIKVGQWLKFPESDLMDWYLLTQIGELKGGYSLRYKRTLIPEEDRSEYDKNIGVSKYI
jgi:uncharacterized protein YegJ (DUF2314 family)